MIDHLCDERAERDEDREDFLCDVAEGVYEDSFRLWGEDPLTAAVTPERREEVRARWDRAMAGWFDLANGGAVPGWAEWRAGEDEARVFGDDWKGRTVVT